ncbi:hypothetical protein, unknown function [Leishmania tarentolae]|uniref:Surface antigen-like protein n=1 Tax=Leishmania tarentolae TaxID=5689 RepID=A0A640KXL2_LEITA|nr:hypothetical protein, unknown function [Leishmania tarentolae]
MPDDVDYSMVKLEQIIIVGQHSGITGTLPSSWGKLGEVRVINLGYTGIVGTLPAAWSSMSSLKSLLLGFTRVSGTLPAEWSAMRAVEEIVLSTTEITGTLPEAWSVMPSLRRLHLQRCNLNGSFPESWARMPSLERVSLHKNNFCGCVPERWVRSATLLVSVDAKHWAANCATADACVETRAPDPVVRSSSTNTMDEGTAQSTLSRRGERTAVRSNSRRGAWRRTKLPPKCDVDNCMWCSRRNSMQCLFCSFGYSISPMGCVPHSVEDAAVIPVGTSAAAAVCVIVMVVSALLA